MVLLGADPGCNGALVFLRNGEPVAYEDMPTVERVVNGTKRHQVNAALLAQKIGKWRVDAAAVEAQHPRPTDSRAGAFAIGEVFGQVKGVLAAIGIPITLVEPRQWRTEMQVKTPQGASYQDRKNASRLRALELFPACAEWFLLRKSADRAEAALLGRWLFERQRNV